VAESWTVRRVLEWTGKDFVARGLDSPRLDAELLVADALGIDRVRLYMDLDRPLVPEELGKVRERVARRRAREPVAYMLGRREFFGRPFAVGPAVLVPRPDTEILVERALELLDEGAVGPVLDLCTGSGAIAVTLASERPALRVDATDLSAAALATARANAEAHGVADRVACFEGDLYAPVSDRRYALITANPPYIADAILGTLQPEVSAHEPRLALAGGADGLDVIRRILAGADAHLADGGTLLCEVGSDQARPVRALGSEAGFTARTHRDLAGHERVVELTRA
jgi:release factor glutamine methyltransferase